MGALYDEHKIGRHYQSQVWLAEHMAGVLKALGMLFGLTAFGTLGYMIIEGWTFQEALFMTVITVSTVGYGEVQPLSSNGQLFSIVLIFAGMCIAAYALNVIGRSALEGELKKFRGLFKMNKEIESLKDHVIVCGYGRLARFIIPDLLDHKLGVVVIDSDPMRLIEVEANGLPYIEGNAHDDGALKAAGIDRAMALLAILPNDSDNVYITLSARNLNSKLRIVARTELQSSEGKLRLAGANDVVAPYRVSGSRIVQQLTHPYVNDFLEITTGRDGQSLVVEQIVLPKDSKIVGKTLRESNIRQESGVMIAALGNPDGSMLLNPGADDEFLPGAKIIAIGTSESFNALAKII